MSFDSYLAFWKSLRSSLDIELEWQLANWATSSKEPLIKRLDKINPKNLIAQRYSVLIHSAELDLISNFSKKKNYTSIYMLL